MKSRIKIILAFIIGCVISSVVSVYATTVILSKDVSYNNSKSKVESTNVQDAMDELFELAKAKKGLDILQITPGIAKDTQMVVNTDYTWRTLNAAYNGAYYYWQLDLTNISFIEVKGKRIEYPTESYHKQRIAIVSSLPGLIMQYTGTIQTMMPEGDFYIALDVSSLTGTYYFIIDVCASDGYVTEAIAHYK